MTSSAKMRTIILLTLYVGWCSFESTVSVVIRSHGDPKFERIVGHGDAVLLIDYWQSRGCALMTERFDELVTKANPFIQAARESNATIVHALAGSMSYVNPRNPLYRPMYWQQTTSDRHRGRKVVQRMTSLVKRKARAYRPPLDLIFSKATSKYFCSGKGNARLHRNVSINYRTDVMFDNGWHFHRLAKRGITRLYYTGSALNQCVLFTRMYSALEAVYSGYFDEVGIILDLTLPLVREVGAQPGCEGVPYAECSQRFGSWFSSSFNVSKLTFWNAHPALEMVGK